MNKKETKVIKMFEGDTIKGKEKTRPLTYVERESVYLVAHKVESEECGAVHNVLKRKRKLRDSFILYDRGSEFALWRMLEKDLNSYVFFCDSHSPWQRGKNENTNGRPRRIFPKGFDFDTISDKQFKRIVKTQAINQKVSRMENVKAGFY